jgi:replicative superfamily II helicase
MKKYKRYKENLQDSISAAKDFLEDFSDGFKIVIDSGGEDSMSDKTGKLMSRVALVRISERSIDDALQSKKWKCIIYVHPTGNSFTFALNDGRYSSTYKFYDDLFELSNDKYVQNLD